MCVNQRNPLQYFSSLLYTAGVSIQKAHKMSKRVDSVLEVSVNDPKMLLKHSVIIHEKKEKIIVYLLNVVLS